MLKEKQLKQQARGRGVYGLSAYANGWLWAMMLVLLAFFIFDLMYYSSGVAATLLLGIALVMFGLCCGVTVRGLDKGAFGSNLVFLFAFAAFTCVEAVVSVTNALSGGQAVLGGVDMGGAVIDGGGGIGVMPMDMSVDGGMDMGMMAAGGAADTAAVVLRYAPLLLAAAVCVAAAVILAVSFIRNRDFFLMNTKKLAARCEALETENGDD